MDQTNEPHIIFLPYPLQGHLKPMLILAELFSHAGLRVTFVNSHHNQARLEHSTDVASFCHRFPKFRFAAISDGLPADHPRSGPRVHDMVYSTRAVTKPEFRKLLIDLSSRENAPSCVIADASMSFGVDIAEELCIPVISFKTTSSCSAWIYLHISKLVEEGEVPFQGADLDKPVTTIPGFEEILRRRDLPGPCRRKEANDPYLQFFITEMEIMRRASGLILNTFEGLEHPSISKLGSIFPKVYAVGPLHGLLDTYNSGSSTATSPSSSGMLRREDKTCLNWLDTKPPRSVISFGTLLGLTHDYLLEFWHGLVNSGKFFLWVMRSDLVIGEDGLGKNIPEELEVATRESGCIVSWAPQVEVLAHPAVGGFLTHGGWNSALESILAGVPMICWPGLGDQLVNSRFVSEAWKLGFDMKDTCDRSIVEKMVRDLMEEKREEIVLPMDEASRQACGSVKEGGSSYGSLDMLIEDLKSMASTRKT